MMIYLLQFTSVLDASGEYAGGFFSGHNLRINSDYCQVLSDEFTTMIAENKTATNQTEIVPFFVQNVIARYKTFVEFHVSTNKNQWLADLSHCSRLTHHPL